MGKCHLRSVFIVLLVFNMSAIVYFVGIGHLPQLQSPDDDGGEFVRSRIETNHEKAADERLGLFQYEVENRLSQDTIGENCSSLGKYLREYNWSRQEQLSLCTTRRG